MNSSEQINELATALAKAQAKIEGAAKDKANPHFKSKYADLASIMDACKEHLTSNGLSVVQVAESETGETVTIHTQLLHSSGQWIGGSLTMRPTKPDPQGIGSAITYARRYALAAIVGVCPEDDDGNAASAAPVAKIPVRDIAVAVENAITGIRAGQSSADVFARWRHFGEKLSAEQRSAVYAALPEDIRDQIRTEKAAHDRAAAEKRAAEQGQPA